MPPWTEQSAIFPVFLPSIDPSLHLTISSANQPSNVVAARSIVLIDSECNGLINYGPSVQGVGFGTLLRVYQLVVHPSMLCFTQSMGNLSALPRVRLIHHKSPPGSHSGGMVLRSLQKNLPPPRQLRGTIQLPCIPTESITILSAPRYGLDPSRQCSSVSTNNGTTRPLVLTLTATIGSQPPSYCHSQWNLHPLNLQFGVSLSELWSHHGLHQPMNLGSPSPPPIHPSALTRTNLIFVILPPAVPLFPTTTLLCNQIFYVTSLPMFWTPTVWEN